MEAKIPKKKTFAWAVEEYLDCRKSLAILADRHAKERAPYEEQMKLLDSIFTEEINRLDGQSIKTKKGTAYRSLITSFRVADREAWFDWVLASKRVDMLTTNVSKEAVKEFMENEITHTPPPGLTMTQIYRIGVLSPTEE